MPLSTSMLQTPRSAAFPDPFLDMASLVMPRQARDILDLSERLWMRNGTYRMAAGRIVRYFITRVNLGKTDATEQRRLQAFLNNQFKIVELLSLIGDDFMCFHGDTPVVTEAGTVPIASLVGKRVNVLSKGGIYRPADFKSYGRQRLMRVTLLDGQEILATPEHKWEIKNSTGRHVEVTTEELVPGSHHIPRVVAPRPEKNDEYAEGVRHGFIYGDGTLVSKNTSRAIFCGDKDKALFDYFEGHGNSRRTYKKDVWSQSGFPACYKLLPSIDRSASYWYGFLSGFLAADGSVDTHGCALLTQKDPEILEAIAVQLPRIGMVASAVRGQRRKVSFSRTDGGVNTYDSRIHMVTLFKQFMQPDDFILPCHREKFEKQWNPNSRYGQYVGVKSVEDTGAVDEVFCCVEAETHRIVIGRGILTAQCYGNSLTSVVVPFRRILICERCGSQVPIDTADWEFTNWKFRAFCHKCRCRTDHKHDDRPERNESRIKVTRWAPQEFHILHHFYSQDAEFYWRIPERIRTDIARGVKFLVQYTPWEIIEACKSNQYFRFNQGVVYHMKEQTLAGINTNGWGVSRMLATFAQSYYVQMLKRYNEALVSDYLAPMRVVTPKQGNGPLDPTSVTSLTAFKSRFMEMVKQHRQDPATWHFMPFPIDYQALGGEVRLTSADLLGQAMDEQLNAIGIPAELYKGTLQLQVMPTALRLFQQTWPQLVSAFNGWLEWAMSAVCTHMNWDKPESVSLEPVTTADDVELRQTWLQLASANLVSRRTAFAPWQLDPAEEQRRMLEEQVEFKQLQDDMAKDMEQKRLSQEYASGAQQQAQPGQQAAPGQMGAGANSTVGMTPDEMNAQAQQMAAELVRIPDELTRKRQLRAIREQAPVLHSLVIANMEQERSNAGAAGRQALAAGQM